ncbi:hypothetical protein KCP74_11230 [Salmonella enterica subsp. enterica]|nr:hypothetical protein KCP74_11230 [Salmonella enterica subsp. enterica]
MNNNAKSISAKEPLLTLRYILYRPTRREAFRRVESVGTYCRPKRNKREWRISGKGRPVIRGLHPVGRLINLAGNAQFYRADLDRNGIQDLVIWLGNLGLAGTAPSARNTSFSPFSIIWRCVFEPWGLYRHTVLASMICLIYRAMGARNCWICSLTQAAG